MGLCYVKGPQSGPYCLTLMNEKLKAIIEPTVTAMGYELWGCQHITQGQHSVLRIYIDSENGITVTDCERVSRQLSAVLDVEEPITSRYTLEVSSPGLDRPLFTLAQYQRFIGNMINVRLQTPVDNRKHLKGLLLAAENDEIVVSVVDKKIVVPLDNIAKAHLLPEI